MTEEWTQARLQREYVDAQVEEGQSLEYKDARALEKSDSKKTEITRDVSAMANAAGGTVVYGVSVFREPAKKHLPEKLSPIDRTEFPKEWLEQVINSGIEPRIEGLIVHAVTLDSGDSHVAYVVEIPQGKTAHQARDDRYYRRYNFQRLSMRHHEIVDVLNRGVVPDVRVEFLLQRAGRHGQHEESWNLRALVRNDGPRLAKHVQLRYALPLKVRSAWRDLGQPERQSCVFKVLSSLDRHAGVRVLDGTAQLSFRTADVLFPEDHVEVTPVMRCFLGDPYFDADARDMARVDWKLWADDMPPKEGSAGIFDLPRH